MGDVAETRLRRLRWVIFRIWFLSLVVMLASLGYAAFGRLVRADEGEIFKSATLMLGLVTPPLGAIFAFYRSSRRLELQVAAISREFYEIVLYASVLYHLILNGLVIYGIALQQLVLTVGHDALYQNCAAIVNWMGLLSVLLGPAAWLFTSSPDSKRRKPTAGAAR